MIEELALAYWEYNVWSNILTSLLVMWSVLTLFSVAWGIANIITETVAVNIFWLVILLIVLPVGIESIIIMKLYNVEKQWYILTAVEMAKQLDAQGISPFTDTAEISKNIIDILKGGSKQIKEMLNK
ncbi:MAG: hypothetical protein Ta2B_14490 [Termitinemataceae bacterium]|nr:MAG: hypothetical protein Ta2B_14490 [Termitinemataceae bacterium]